MFWERVLPYPLNVEHCKSYWLCVEFPGTLDKKILLKMHIRYYGIVQKYFAIMWNDLIQLYEQFMTKYIKRT